MTLVLLLKYWREAAIVAALCALAVFVHANNVSQQRIGALNESLKNERTHGIQLSAEYARAKEVVKVDTVRVVRTIFKYQQLRDTLNIHDTISVKEFVVASDSVRKVCTDLKTSCQRALASADSLLQSERRVNAILMQQRPGKMGLAMKLITAVGVGYAIHAVTH